jgi:hypothetical protein
MVELAEKLPAQRGKSLLGAPPHDLILRVRGGQHSGYVVRLSDLKCTIGSHARCTFRLRAAGVKPWHCVVFRGAEATFVRRIDENTRLNGRAFELASLSTGDRLSVGPVELEVIDEQVAQRRPARTSTSVLPHRWHDPSASVRAAAEQAARQAGQLKDALARTRHAATQRVRQLAEQLRSAREQIQELQEQSERSRHESAAEAEAAAQQQELLAVEFERRKLELESDLERRRHQLEARTAEQRQQEQALATKRAAAEQELDARQRELDEQRDQIRRERSQAEQEISEARHVLNSSSERWETQEQQLEQARAEWEQQRRGQQENLLAQAELLKQRRADLAAMEAEIQADRNELEKLRSELQQLRATTCGLQQPPTEGVDSVLPADSPAAMTTTDETAQVVEATLRSLIGRSEPSVPGADSDVPTPREQTEVSSAEDDEPREREGSTSETVSDVLARVGKTVDWMDHVNESSPADAAQHPASPAPAPLDTAAEAPPPSTSPDQPAVPAGGDEEPEESVEDYMARLMQRLRGGDTASPAPAASAVSVPTSEEAAVAHVLDTDAETPPASDVVEPPAPVAPPIQPCEYKPRNQAPERGAGLDALRDLANSSARSAISTHKVKTHGKAAMGRAIAAGLALLGAVAFVCWQGYDGVVGLAGTGIALVLAMIWGVQAVFLAARTLHARRITKRIDGEQSRESEDPGEAPEAIDQATDEL